MTRSTPSRISRISRISYISRRAREIHRAVFATVFGLLLAATAFAQDDRWIHVRVQDTGADPVEVNVNLPIELVESALGLIPEEIQAEVEWELESVGVEIGELRAFWREARGVNDAVFVTVETADESVLVEKKGEYLLASTVERGPNGVAVDLRLPFGVLDGLFGTDRELDFVSAVRAVAEAADGDLLEVVDGQTEVRVWVDDVNQPSR